MMRWGWLGVAGICWAGVAGAAGVPAVGDGGGRDVRVALFSTMRVGAVVVMPLRGGAWVERCGRCRRESLAEPMRIGGRAEVWLGGAVQVMDEGSRETRSATGLWHVRSNEAGVDVVLTLPSERYVEAVVQGEAAAGETAEALRALAVVARTYALNGIHYRAGTGHLAAELCDSTQCQAMRLGGASREVEEAVRATAGETLWFGRQRAEVYFSEQCGGVTEDVRAVWAGGASLPYLRSHADPYCLRRGTAAWHAEVRLEELSAVARAEGWRVPERVIGAQVVGRSGSGRALKVELRGNGGERAEVDAGVLRFGVGRALGWNRIRSNWYEVAVRNGRLIFDGRGYGHGVGLCQVGAAEMAAEHKSAREILAFYFPGTRVGIGPADGGWTTRMAGGLTVRSVGEVSAGRMAAMERSWGEARRLFAPRGAAAAEVVLAPTTEMFRQLTAQPGWMLASTSGARVVLQPAAVLGDRERITVLHEMLHVLVESEATGKAPLWLREGLVEALAGGKGGAGMELGEMERGLRALESQGGSERAHRAAGVRVRGLVGRYGMATVRGWLVAGVPAGVL